MQRVEAFHADLYWSIGANAKWRFQFRTRSHFHLSCSEKGNHAGTRERDDERMVFRGDRLPPGVEAIINATGVLLPGATEAG